MRKIILLSIAVCSLTGCYYDNEDELHPSINISNSCDTTIEISYANDIAPIMNSSCGATDNNCHSINSTSSGIPLDNYSNIYDVILDGSFLGSILHEQAYSPMPQGGGKLDDCSISKIQSWINHNAPNN